MMSLAVAKSVAWTFATPGVGYAPANQFTPSSEIHVSQLFGVKPSPCGFVATIEIPSGLYRLISVSYTHLRAHET